nr:RNA-directed DNA polymerase, eukaryota [Tanacetum cinerariifolium]
MGIGVPQDVVTRAANSIGCATLSAQFYYLGVKIGDSCSKSFYWEDILAKISSRLSKWKLKTLSIGGRLTLLKLVLSSMPLYQMSVYKVPLGIDLHSFVKKKVGNGDQTLFWEDTWLTNPPLKFFFPRLYALEGDKHASVAAKLGDSSLVNSLRRAPCGGVEEEQLQLLVDKVATVVLSNLNERWVWTFELPSRINLSLRGIDILSILCPICSCAGESSSHLLFSRNVARLLLLKVARWWELDIQDCMSYADWLFWFNALCLSKGIKRVLEGVFYIRRYPNEFLVLIGLSHMWYAPAARPVFYDNDDEEDFIKVPNPFDVDGAENNLAKNKRYVLEQTADIVTLPSDHVVNLGPVPLNQMLSAAALPPIADVRKRPRVQALGGESASKKGRTVRESSFSDVAAGESAPKSDDILSTRLSEDPSSVVASKAEEFVHGISTASKRLVVKGKKTAAPRKPMSKKGQLVIFPCKSVTEESAVGSSHDAVYVLQKLANVAATWHITLFFEIRLRLEHVELRGKLERRLVRRDAKLEKKDAKIERLQKLMNEKPSREMARLSLQGQVDEEAEVKAEFSRKLANYHRKFVERVAELDARLENMAKETDGEFSPMLRDVKKTKEFLVGKGFRYFLNKFKDSDLLGSCIALLVTGVHESVQDDAGTFTNPASGETSFISGGAEQFIIAPSVPYAEDAGATAQDVTPVDGVVIVESDEVLAETTPNDNVAATLASTPDILNSGPATLVITTSIIFE